MPIEKRLNDGSNVPIKLNMNRIVSNITYDFILNLITELCTDLNPSWVNPELISKYVFGSIKKEMIMVDLYGYIADYCINKASYHPDFNKLASKICVKILHERTSHDFRAVMDKLYNNVDRDGKHSPIIKKDIFDVVEKYHEQIQKEIDYTRDYLFDYFGIKTLERSYLYKLHYIRNSKGNVVKSYEIVERPQHMFMRVALGIHGNNLNKAFESYNYMSKKYFTHATPTLFNAGSIRPQMSSCFLLYMGDSLEDIFDTVKEVAQISKWAGGIGLSLSDIRAKGSIIRKTNGISDGIIPLCKLLNVEAKYINQGGKRNGSIAVYLEVWHADIFAFCELRKNTEDENAKARDLFLALWVCDLFMKRVKANEMWSLMCPDECPGLTSSYGEDFENLYIKYEKEGKYRKQIRATELWFHILGAQIETGMPFMLYKDHCNRKSNQKNLGTIRCSNLCSEIVEYTDRKSTAVCNLASICLPMFIEVRDGKNVFNFEKLVEIAGIVVRNLDYVIDKNFYPTEKTQYSNSNHRPIGVGIQGLADVYNIMEYPFDSKEASELNKLIFESLYFGCMVASNKLAIELGPYNSFKGSPSSQGILQFHMWGLKENDLSGRYDWGALCKSIKEHGLRNSLLTTAMPTASTSQIMGNSEGIDPYLSNAYTRLTLAGEFMVINENLVNALIGLGIWSEEVRRKIIVMNGSVASIAEIPKQIRDIYKTAFEIKLKSVIQQAADRGVFMDQSQSLNFYLENSDFDRLTSAHFFAWSSGLKTGMYYLRSRPSVDPIQFGIGANEIKQIKTQLLQPKQGTVEGLCKIRPGVKISECTACT